jgi:mRNA interferase MazF
VTSNIERILPFQVMLPAAATGLRRDSKAQAEQVRSLSILRVGDTVARLSGEDMLKLDEALRLHLDLLR